MKIHILGICGTFMGGIALLARASGIEVTGADSKVYPPMSTMLANEGISLVDGYDPAQLPTDADSIVIGNFMRRGMPVIERVLDQNLAYVSYSMVV